VLGGYPAGTHILKRKSKGFRIRMLKPEDYRSNHEIGVQIHPAKKLLQELITKI